MFSGINQSIVIFAVIAAYYVIDTLMFVRYERQRRQKGTGKAWGYTIAMLALAVLLVVQPVVLPILGLRTDQWWGYVIQLVGITSILRHTLVETGPYALLRHPTFTSFFLITTGLLFVNPALTTLLTVLYSAWDFTRAALQEEELLIARLPEYREYMANTPRFFPKFRRRKRKAQR
jgi:protein-S-isoprenylcysteine O-methyltransferase Ste14